MPAESGVFILRLADSGNSHVIDHLEVADLSVKTTHDLGFANANCIGVSQSTGHLWVGDKKGKIHIYDIENGFAEVGTKDVSRLKICHILPVTADGAQMASFDGLGEICIWDSASGEKTTTMRA